MKKKKIKFVYTCMCLLMGLTMTSFKGTEALEKLKKINQEHLLQFWDDLTGVERKELSRQIEELNIQTFTAQRETILNPIEDVNQTLTPFKDYEIAGSLAHRGRQLIAEGKVGCLIVAGGQGSRLGYEGPKGLFPITVIKKKSLFQLFAERVLAAGNQVDRKLLMAIMTSSVNHGETVKYFEDHHYFGLDRDQVFFFAQTDLPFLNKEGDLFLESRSKIAAGPDGNAASLKHFVDRNIWFDWYNRGVRYLNYVHIDNALGDPFDAELIGFHDLNQSELVIKCVKREDPFEKVGIILKNNGKVQVIEYSEIKDEERLEHDANGALKHLCANISMFSFKMNFVKQVADECYGMFPFHKAWKAVKHLKEDGKPEMSKQPQAWKFEKFIFDLLPYAKDVKALLYPREICFAPLKNATGLDSVEDVRKALQKFDRLTFQNLSHDATLAEDATFELDPQFYYPTKSICEKWKNRNLPSTLYVNP